jgi:type II secretory pathway component PulK
MNNRQATTKYYVSAQANRSGIALLLTLVVLVVLSGIVYSLATRITMRKHRQQYIIDYQKARYACDSGLKYAYTMIPKISLTIKQRTEDFPNLLDFSDIFWMDSQQYEDFRFQWYDRQQELLELDALEEGQPMSQSESPIRNEEYDESLDRPNGEMTDEMMDEDGFDLREMLGGLMGSDEYYDEYDEDWLDPNDIEIPGPYNVQWPYVIEPIEFEMGEAKVKITIEDENAKLPLIWATQGSTKEMDERSEIALETFCSWMQMEDEQIDNLKEQVRETAIHKQFRHTYKPATVTEVVKPKPTKSKTTKGRARRTRTAKPVKRTVKKQRDPAAHAADFAKLIHRSTIDLTELSRQIPEIEGRDESPIKYLALWGSTKVNINAAPRHVLEATFSYGGQAEDIADEIIQLRREEPFKNLKDLEEKMYGFTDSVKQVTPYITTQSEYMTIKVTASYGKAVTTSIAAVRKTGKKFKIIAAFSY